MAGLQYYFFPTDFLYPRPPTSSAVIKGGDTINNQALLPLQAAAAAAAADDDLDLPETNGPTHRNVNVKELSLSSPSSSVPAVVANSGKKQGAGGKRREVDEGDTAELSPLCLSRDVPVPVVLPGKLGDLRAIEEF